MSETGWYVSPFASDGEETFEKFTQALRHVAKIIDNICDSPFESVEDIEYPIVISRRDGKMEFRLERDITETGIAVADIATYLESAMDITTIEGTVNSEPQYIPYVHAVKELITGNLAAAKEQVEQALSEGWAGDEPEYPGLVLEEMETLSKIAKDIQKG
jgi:hypothetical protein